MHPSPPTPSTCRSNSSESRLTPASQNSYASSFAPLIRDNRHDKRLFKRKSKPSQHLEKRKPLLKPKLVQRSPSFYRPKVVADSADSKQPPPIVLIPEKPLELNLPAALSKAPVRTSLRATASLPSHSESHVQLVTSSSLPTVKTPAYVSFKPSPEVSVFEYTPDSPRSSGFPESPANNKGSLNLHLLPTPAPQRPQLRRNIGSGSSVVRRPNCQTPPESEPSTPYDSYFRVGDHYFQTFGPDTIYEKPTASAALSLPKYPGPVAQRSETSMCDPEIERPVSETLVSAKKMRKHTGVFNVFRASASSGSSRGARSSAADTTSTRATPTIEVTAPQLARSRRQESISTEGLNSYFSAPPVPKKSALVTPGSPISTH